MVDINAGRARLYDPIFLGLNDAAIEIARRKVRAFPTHYPDEAAALDDARRELLAALLDGAVHSEGVPIPGDPGPNDPNEPPTPPEPGKWEPIAAGWWSHETYEQYVVRTTDLEVWLLKLVQTADQNLDECQIQREQVVKGVFILDFIMLGWNGDTFERIGLDAVGYCRIRVLREDINAHFHIETPNLNPEAFEQIADATENPTTAQLDETGIAQKRETRPNVIERDVRNWLDQRLQQKGPDSISTRSDLWLALEYLKTKARASQRYVCNSTSISFRENGLTG
jgi:hypothetical protein